MAGGLVGADVAELRKLAVMMRNYAQDLDTMAGSFDMSIPTMAWQGRDAAAFHDQWQHDLRPVLIRVAETLRDAQEVLETNAQQQQDASEAGGSVASLFGASALLAGAGIARAGWNPFGYEPETPQAKYLKEQAARLRDIMNQPASKERSDAIRAWANHMSPEQRKAFAEKYPGEVGNTDGMPVSMRNTANRILMDNRITELERKNEELKKRFQAYPVGGPRPGTHPASAHRDFLLSDQEGRELALLKSLREGKNIRYEGGQLADHGPAPDRKDAYVLVFDQSGGGDTRIAVSQGNPETVKYVAITVPGVSSDISKFDGMYGDAWNLRGGDPDTAVIAWLGYDTPEGITPEAASEKTAAEGADSLQQFVGGLDLDGSQEVSVIGHSYGSIVTMIAAENGGLPTVDNIVTLGSPGSERYDHVNDIGLTPHQDFYAMGAHGDLIAGNITGDLPGHGSIEPDDAAFGATILETDPWGDADEKSYGHSKYYKLNSGGLRNLQGVIHGGGDSHKPGDYGEGPFIA